MSEERKAQYRGIERHNIEAHNKKNKLRHVVDLVGASPASTQLELLQGLLDDPRQADAFMKSPQEYAAERGVVVDPELVRGMVDILVFGEPVTERMTERLGPDVTSTLLDLRGDGRVAAIPVAVATAVAVASAAVAVIAQAGYTLDASRIKGFTGRPSRSLVASSGAAVLIYAVTAATTAAAADRASFRGLHGHAFAGGNGTKAKA